MKNIICIVCKTNPIYDRYSVLCLMCLSEVYEKFQRRIKRSGPIGQEERNLRDILLYTQEGLIDRVLKEKP